MVNRVRFRSVSALQQLASSSALEFRILGPLEAWDGGRAVALGGPRPRALLAMLLLHVNEVVSADRLIEDLWGEDSPEDAAAALRVNVSRLRKAVPPDVLTTRSPGYALQIEPDALDLHRFERLVDEARSLLARGLAADGSERLHEALALWRGPALVDFAYESFAQAAIARLEEIRLAAVELRIDADLALGRHDDLVGELEGLVAEHPLRERLRACLMTALYRSGRQAEALEAYQDGRRALVDGLGIEPGPALQQLERAVLRQDPALDGEAPSALVRRVAERSLLVAIEDEAHVEALLSVAEPLARQPTRILVLARLVPDASALQAGSAWLEDLRSQLDARGVVARAASFTSSTPGSDLARLAAELDVDLLLAAAPDHLVVDGIPDEQLSVLLEETPCDVALVTRDGTPADAVLVPFGGGEHDWAAVELAAWLAKANGAPLRLAGAAAVPEHGKRDASRLLSHGALAVQRVLGIAAEPLLVTPGDDGMLEAARDAGLVVVGLSSRWHREGLGEARLRLAREATATVLFVRRGLRPGGLAPPAALTHFTWSIRP
jgi:DNA-binding SARP family transcriptional activator